MPSDNVYREKRMPGPLAQVWRRFYHDAMSMLGLYGFTLLILLCLFGTLFAPYHLDQQFLGYQLPPPSWSRYGDVSFFLGTDDLGRDVLSRLLAGTAPTFGSALVVTMAAALVGLALGVLAGVTRGLRSAALNHVLNGAAWRLQIENPLSAGPQLPYTERNMYDLTTYFAQSLPPMMTRKSIDTVLFSVAADKLSQREWDWIKLMKPMDPPAAMVVSAILEHRGDTAALTRLQEARH